MLDFTKLESLRRSLAEIRKSHLASLEHYRHKTGFGHLDNKKRSVSSTSTCVLSLVVTDQWDADRASTRELIEWLLQQETSADLKKNNAFTLAFVLEAVTALEKHSDPIPEAAKERIGKIEEILIRSLKSGAVRVDQYPESAYLTQLVVRVLSVRGKLTTPVASMVRDWALRELTFHLALARSESRKVDPYAIAYSLILLVTLAQASHQNSDEKEIIRNGINTFFDYQYKDGLWPPSRPLFMYPNFGNALCFEYELLLQLLQTEPLHDFLLDHIDKLAITVDTVISTAHKIGDGVRIWSSGHHPQSSNAESWATASVYQFVHALDRLAAEAVRIELFRQLETPYTKPIRDGAGAGEFAPNFLDANLNISGTPRSLKGFLLDSFVGPLAKEKERIAQGKPFRKGTPRSAIFFGPPGTSKTELTKAVAQHLGWPHLAIDPSHLLRNGLDGIQAETNRIFRMLEEAESVVVLFDEFDELVRERASVRAEPLSRFLTTAMLPKLANIHKRATLVFVIATNHVGGFDFAIRRHGRFDHVVQIMPPTLEEKLAKASWGSNKVNLRELLDNWGIDTKARLKIGDLTYGECESLVEELCERSSTTGSSWHPSEATGIIHDHWGKCTMQSKVGNDSNDSWATVCREEGKHNR